MSTVKSKCVECEIETESIWPNGLCDDCNEYTDDAEPEQESEEGDSPDLIGNEWYHEDLP